MSRSRSFAVIFFELCLPVEDHWVGIAWGANIKIKLNLMSEKKVEKKEERSFKQIEKYVVTNIVLGKGAFGVVYRGFEKENKANLVAVKSIEIGKAKTDKNYIKLLKREIEILKQIQNENIVKLYHASRTTNNLYMFFQYCKNGDLKLLLQKRGGRLSQSQTLIYIRQICNGFKPLHQKNIIHRDIKPANILLHDNGMVKISDFGFARVIEECTDMNQKVMMTLLGTPLYMAPQILAQEKFSYKCDIWSLGMLFYELLYGQLPWTGNNQYNLLKNIRNTPLQFPKEPKMSQKTKELIGRILQVDEQNRISWNELFAHELIDDNEGNEGKIGQQIFKITQETKDELLKKKLMNELYIKMNKIIGKDKGEKTLKPFAQKEKEQEVESHPIKKEKESTLTTTMKMKNTSDDNYDKIIQLQDEKQVCRKIISKIDGKMLYERNVTIFINVTTNNYYKAFSQNLQEYLFYMGLVVLQKYQIDTLKGLLKRMTNKKEDKEYSEEDWKKYSESNQFVKTLMTIKSDLKYIEPYYNEVLLKTKMFLNNLKKGKVELNTLELIELFYGYIQGKDPLSVVGYKQILNEILKSIDYKSLEREHLGTYRFLQIAKCPQKHIQYSEQTQADFHSFYQDYEKMETQKLIKQIEQQQ